jgi:hypothetical protein
LHQGGEVGLLKANARSWYAVVMEVFPSDPFMEVARKLEKKS